ncbi:dihydrodipicolinate synthase family protein [Halosimplex aquaticum]
MLDEQSRHGRRRLRSSFETVAFTTPVPFDAEDEVDHEALADNLSGLYDAGARLFVPCGNTGEYYALTDEERVAVVETHAEATGDEATIAAGASGNEREVLALAERYREAGADAVMVMHPDHTYVHERGWCPTTRRSATGPTSASSSTSAGRRSPATCSSN